MTKKIQWFCRGGQIRRMGWPKGWSSVRTDSACLVTEWFHKWQHWLSKRFGKG
jgi:hypothetical protein